MNLRRSSILLIAVVGLLASNATVNSQGRQGDVLVTVTNDKIMALPAGGSAIEEGLAVNERVEKTLARGQTGFAQTLNRFLGIF